MMNQITQYDQQQRLYLKQYGEPNDPAINAKPLTQLIKSSRQSYQSSQHKQLQNFKIDYPSFSNTTTSPNTHFDYIKEKILKCDQKISLLQAKCENMSIEELDLAIKGQSNKLQVIEKVLNNLHQQIMLRPENNLAECSQIRSFIDQVTRLRAQLQDILSIKLQTSTSFIKDGSFSDRGNYSWQKRNASNIYTDDRMKDDEQVAQPQIQTYQLSNQRVQTEGNSYSYQNQEYYRPQHINSNQKDNYKSPQKGSNLQDSYQKVKSLTSSILKSSDLSLIQSRIQHINDQIQTKFSKLSHTALPSSSTTSHLQLSVQQQFRSQCLQQLIAQKETLQKQAHQIREDNLISQITNLEMGMVELEQQISTIGLTRDKLIQELSQKKDELQNCEMQCEMGRAENSRLKDREEALNQTNQESLLQVKELERSYFKIKAELDQDLQRLRVKEQEKQESLTRISAQLNETEKAKQALTIQSMEQAELLREQAQEIQTWRQKLLVSEESNTKLVQQNDQLMRQQDVKESQIKRAKQELHEISMQMGALEMKHQRINEQAGVSFDLQLRQKDTYIKELNDAICSLKLEGQQQMALNKEQERNLMQVQTEAGQLIQDLNARVGLAEQDSKMHMVISEEDQKLTIFLKASLQEEKTAKEELFNQLTSEKDKNRVHELQCFKLSNELETHNRQFVKFETNIAEAQTQIALLQQQKEEADQEKILMQRLISKLENQLLLFETQHYDSLNNLDSQAQLLANSVQDSNQVNAELQAEMQEMREHFEREEVGRRQAEERAYQAELSQVEMQEHLEQVHEQVSGFIKQKCAEMSQQNTKIQKLKALEEIQSLIKNYKKAY